jgi:ubiquinone/menaquinone biosynthesis C-methylase UbiE
MRIELEASRVLKLLNQGDLSFIEHISTKMPRSETQSIERNAAIHDRIARKYEAIHDEIFNDIEQQRLAAALERSQNCVQTRGEPLQALDFGCGSGNVTRHLLDLGLSVTSADVSSEFLQLVRSRFPAVKPLLMNGKDLSNVADCSFDLVATYSVLHHIPDYLSALAEMARVCKPGGVIAVDHEKNESFWSADEEYFTFQKEALRIDWRKYFRPMNYVHRVRRIFDPRYANEGDIHVWPDDHIEWPKVRDTMSKAGCEVVVEEDYLLYRGLYRREVYERFANRCTDTKLIVFRKCAE